jgi:hypothetical protein
MYIVNTCTESLQINIWCVRGVLKVYYKNFQMHVQWTRYTYTYLGDLISCFRVPRQQNAVQQQSPNKTVCVCVCVCVCVRYQ